MNHFCYRQSRADDRARCWLIASSGAIVAIIHALAANKMAEFIIALVMLRQAGWGDVIARIDKRIDKSLHGRRDRRDWADATIYSELGQKTRHRRMGPGRITMVNFKAETTRLLP
jgi:hypothetical protein